MPQSWLPQLYLQIALMLAVSLLLGHALRVLLRIPPVFGELLSGLVLGPTLIGAVAPSLYAIAFPSTGPVVAGRQGVMSFGLLLFLYTAGLETGFTGSGRHWRAVMIIGGLGLVVPFAFGFGAACAFPKFWSQPVEDTSDFGLLLAVLLSISALPVAARTLADLDMLRTKPGRTIMNAAMLDDLVGWTFFALLTRLLVSRAAESGQNWALAIIGLSALAASPYLSRTVARAGDISATGLTIILILLSALGTQALGLEAMFGAFLLGVVVARSAPSMVDAATTKVIRSVSLSVFTPIYFCSLGQRTDFRQNFDLTLALAVLGIACTSKIVGAGAGALLSGYSVRDAAVVGIGLNARGAVEMVIAAAALDLGLIDERLYVALVLMALVTSLACGPLMTLAMRCARSEPVVLAVAANRSGSA